MLSASIGLRAAIDSEVLLAQCNLEHHVLGVELTQLQAQQIVG